MSNHPLLEAIAEAASSLPRSVLESLSESLERLPPHQGAGHVRRLAQAPPQPGARAVVERLVAAWNRHAPDAEPKAVALALRAAAQAAEDARERQAVEVVWTGPAPDGAKLRRTEQALLDVIHEAKRELLVVAYTAYKLPTVAEALAKAAERGVTITFVAESSTVSDGKVAFGALEALGKTVAAHAKVYVWPLDQRPRDEAGHHGSLHVKCAVADEELLFVSSANLTEFAVSLNMELGVLVRGGAAPKRVAEHLRGLIAAGVLAGV